MANRQCHLPSFLAGGCFFKPVQSYLPHVATSNHTISIVLSQDEFYWSPMCTSFTFLRSGGPRLRQSEQYPKGFGRALAIRHVFGKETEAVGLEWDGKGWDESIRTTILLPSCIFSGHHSPMLHLKSSTPIPATLQGSWFSWPTSKYYDKSCHPFPQQGFVFRKWNLQIRRNILFAVQNMKKRSLKMALSMAAKKLQPLKVSVGQLVSWKGFWMASKLSAVCGFFSSGISKVTCIQCPLKGANRRQKSTSAFFGGTLFWHFLNPKTIQKGHCQKMGDH